MQFLQSTEYAIHSLFYLAVNHQEQAVLVSEVAKAQNISEAYLAKIFQNLARAGLVRSFRGARGGYSLAQSPERITIHQIVKTMEGDSPIFVCNNSKRHCELFDNCYLKSVMQEAEAKLCEILEQTTLQDLVDTLRGFNRQIAWLRPAPARPGTPGRQ